MGIHELYAALLGAIFMAYSSLDVFARYGHWPGGPFVMIEGHGVESIELIGGALSSRAILDALPRRRSALDAIVLLVLRVQ